MWRCSPRVAAYLVAIVIALSFCYDLLRVPVQVSDSLEELIAAQGSPSLYATIAATAQGDAYLRPFRHAQIKVLFDVAEGHYWLVYRGFHALLLLAALLLFTRVLRVDTWTDCAAAVFALTVLTGLHTFRGTVREAFPINHFLEIVVFCLIASNIARSREGVWTDLAAAATFVLASLTLESGLLVWVVIATAWASGMRGVSRRGIIAITALLGAYFLLRFWFLSVGLPGLEERSSGFLLRTLEPDELNQRFGANPTWFYLYNVAASVISVLFSELDGGVFELGRSWMQGDVPPRLYVAIISSVATTALIAWVAVSRMRGRRGQAYDDRDRLLFIAATVLIANSALSYAYTKQEIMSVAGVFYAFVAARHWIEYLGERASGAARIAVVLMLAAVSSLWTIRSAGAHHMLRAQAFTVRNDWARLPAERMRDVGNPGQRRTATLIRQLRHDALEAQVSDRYLLPRWTDRWWGE